MTSSPLIYLSASEIRQALPMSAAVDAMRDAFKALASGQVTLPVRQNLVTSDQAGFDLVMPCYCAAAQLFSLKTVTVFQDNPGRNLPAIQGLLVLTDAQTGEHVAVLDGTSLTAIRTGAASGLATEVLARPESATVAIIGAGVQGRTQLEAVCAVRQINRVRIYDRAEEAARRFAEEMSTHLSLVIDVAMSPEASVEGADIICTATSSTSPVLPDRRVPPGTHINAVGAYRPDMGEIPPVVVQQSHVVVDHCESALDEAGDLLQTIQQGLIDRSDLATELGNVVLGKSPGRSSSDQVTLFKSVGIAVQDLYAASATLGQARKLQLGTELSR